MTVGSDAGVPDSIAQALSARELEVLLLLDEHLGTDEIAKRLFISEHTVRSHVKSLLRKLNVCSRREALEALSRARTGCLITHSGGYEFTHPGGPEAMRSTGFRAILGLIEVPPADEDSVAHFSLTTGLAQGPVISSLG